MDTDALESISRRYLSEAVVALDEVAQTVPGPSARSVAHSLAA